ncbi:hypothetical protein T07_731 [Trichinella nelsoni]|uniref:Uncharacterized protein n=1 Tax=Trichinella nelsoni TaxID=6336 RepID=A0A0V0S3P5_9BILA|nr:hypothetical protein T07_731 [Trichinella nelsoni]
MTLSIVLAIGAEASEALNVKMGQFDPENNRRVKFGILAILIHWKASHFFRYISRTTRSGSGCIGWMFRIESSSKAII